MKTLREQVTDALASGDSEAQLHSLFEWDMENGPSTEQMNAVATLMGWRPRSDKPEVTTFANTVTNEELLAMFQQHGRKVEHAVMTHWEYLGWRAERWAGGGIYFYNPVCKSTAADAYEVLMQI